jgi:hypothetical protein
MDMQFALGLTFLLGFFVGIGPAQTGSEIPTKLGLNLASAKEAVLESLTSGSVYNDAAMRTFKALAPAARAAIVRGGLDAIKAYVETAEFKAAYMKFRDNEKPNPPEARPSADEAWKKQKADFEKQIAEMKKNLAGLDAETRKSMEAAVKQMQAQMEKMDKDTATRDLMRQMVEAQKVEDKNQYAEQVKVWEENYPADPRILIQKRIRDFLETSADVDFEAKLIASGSKKRFANEDFEGKPAEWKICFRAGKEATEAARAFARSWLTELEKK